jgi:hypothetical protein
MAMNTNPIPVDPAFAPYQPPETFPYSYTYHGVPGSPVISTNGLTNVATDLLDAADKHVPTLSLNARRKSFHALAFFMFVPGIIFDVSCLISSNYA